MEVGTLLIAATEWALRRTYLLLPPHLKIHSTALLLMVISWCTYGIITIDKAQLVLGFHNPNMEDFLTKILFPMPCSTLSIKKAVPRYRWRHFSSLHDVSLGIHHITCSDCTDVPMNVESYAVQVKRGGSSLLVISPVSACSAPAAQFENFTARSLNRW